MPWNRLGDGLLGGVTDEQIAKGIFGESGLIPRYFMTGDGHQEPSFQWAAKCTVMKNYFETAMKKQQLCAHVERLPRDVGAGNVPAFLQPLYQQNRIFGWELPIFAPLAKCGQLYFGIAPALANNNIDRALVQAFSEFSHFALEAHQLVASVGSPAELVKIPALLNDLRVWGLPGVFSQAASWKPCILLVSARLARNFVKMWRFGVSRRNSGN
ncbi:MAG TPA: hypothetical protein VME47_17595, partial [Acetobacteraceae bacterium]|nr:hypothetical protein [Acetobacteraceae bacterium]